MAHLIPFAYRPGTSLLHRMDVRYKFFAVCLVSISLLSARLPAVILYFSLLFFFFRTASLGMVEMLKSLRYFILLLFFVFAARALSVTGDVLFSFQGLSITEQGLNEGGLVAFKFFLVMMTGLLFSSTTKPSCVKNAVQWFLRPIPFVPEKRVAVMVSLSLGFMPIILKQARQISDAQKARCGDLRKNPVKKIIRLGLPLMRKAFASADHLVLAMESRCYTDDRTDTDFTSSGKEMWFLAGSIAFSLGFLCL